MRVPETPAGAAVSVSARQSGMARGFDPALEKISKLAG